MRKQLLFLLAICMGISMQAQIKKLSIDSVQWVSASDLANCKDQSRYDGDTVEISGVCLVDGLDYGSSSHNIQISVSGVPSPFGAIRFRQGDPNASYLESIRNLVAGDSIVAKGIMSQYQGETQFQPLETNDAIKVMKQGIAVKDTVLSVGDFNDNARNNNLSTGEQWESAFVTLKDVTVISVDPFGGNRVSFTVADKNGNRINVGDHFFIQKTAQYTHPVSQKPGTFVAPNVGDKFLSISGVIIHSKNNCPSENGRGYEIHPFKSSHYVKGQSSPSITKVKADKNPPTSSQSVKITADISDDGTVTKAELYWAKGENPQTASFTKVNMTLTSGVTYEGTIPAQADNSFIMYYLRAEDNQGNPTQVPNTDPKQGAFSYRVRNGGLTIFDVQWTPFPDGASPFMNQEVTITGVVTASANDDHDLGLVHIQEEGRATWSGIEVTNAGVGALNKGDKISVTGTITEQFGKTRIAATSPPSKNGTGTITPLYIAPDSINHTRNSTQTEQYESVLLGFVNKTGNKKIHVVQVNADAPNSNFGEYLVGRDALDPNIASRVLAGRNAQGSLWVSYVNDGTIIDPLKITKVIVSDTMKMDTLVGICQYAFGSTKLLPRNNQDFIGMNFAGHDTLGIGDTTSGGKDTTTSVAQHFDALQNISFYPNPANNTLTIENNTEFSTVDIELVDMQGRSVAFIQIAQKAVLETVGIPQGIYMVAIKNNENAVISRNRLIIQH